MSAITELLITNTSADYPLRISAQVRKAPEPVAQAIASPTRRPDAQLSPEERAALEKRGDELVDVEIDERTFSGQIRKVKQARWQADGATSLVHWLSLELTKRTTAPDPAPRSVRVVDEWHAPSPVESVPPFGRAILRLQDNRRVLIECKDKDAYVQVANPSNTHTLGLRTRDKKGAVSRPSFVPPGQAALLQLGEAGGIVEQLGT